MNKEIFKNREDIFKVAGQNESWLILQEDGSTRQKNFDDWYEQVSEIGLVTCVPSRIRFYFDTTKNALLYSWFSYEMMPMVELFSYTLVEKSLRMIYECEECPGVSFAMLLKRAIEDERLNDSGFHVPKNTVIEKMSLENDELIIERFLRTHEELELSQKYIKPICELLPKVRNKLAHGNGGLHPAAWLTLKINSEIINMLFSQVCKISDEKMESEQTQSIANGD